MEYSLAASILTHISGFVQGSLIVGIGHRDFARVTRHLPVEENDIVGEQVHVAIDLHAVAVTHKRRIARHDPIFEIVVVGYGLAGYIHRCTMVSQFVVDDVVALVLIELIVK